MKPEKKGAEAKREYSMSPDGRRFALPQAEDYEAEGARLDSLVLGFGLSSDCAHSPTNYRPR